mmetsp:Transcript_6349/g.17767  ORF Transcript_6349/g.17767 Transcript_6349/m.17767 type:complete len:259 (-) Transcript_6349:295-1071(-)
MHSRLLIVALAIVFTAVPGQDLAEEEEDVDAEDRGGPTVVLPLNRYTFDGNVIDSGLANHWIVSFCVDWHSPCRTIQSAYDVLSSISDSRINNDTLLSSKVRFATVDCATDKWLCNEQLVEDYPTISHYNGGELVAQWTDGGGRPAKEVVRLAQWMAEELQHARDDRIKAPAGFAAPPLEDGAVSHDDVFCVAAMLLPVAAISAWVVYGGDAVWRTQRRLLSLASADKDSRPARYAEPDAAGRMSRILPHQWASEVVL